MIHPVSQIPHLGRSAFLFRGSLFLRIHAACPRLRWLFPCWPTPAHDTDLYLRVIFFGATSLVRSSSVIKAAERVS
jgi:hypothetical protein